MRLGRARRVLRRRDRVVKAKVGWEVMAVFFCFSGLGYMDMHGMGVLIKGV